MHVRDLARRQTRAALETLIAMMTSAVSEDVRVRAAVALLDRGWGKPMQTMDIAHRDYPGLPRGFFAALILRDPSKLQGVPKELLELPPEPALAEPS